MDATLFSSAMASSWRGSGRTRGTIDYAPPRATTPPAGRGGATKIGSNAHSGSNSATASTYPERRRSSPFHAGCMIERRPEPFFISIGGPKAHATLSMTYVLFSNLLDYFRQ